MNDSPPVQDPYAPQRTQVTCSKCGKAATVPFRPTPGRPVFCRDCFQRPAPGARPGGPRPAPTGARGPNVRKRMMAQGRKGHFIFDATAALVGLPGGMDDKDTRAFLEGLFARGARTSTEAAQEFLDEKVGEKVITTDQRDALGRLVEKYSFYR